MNDAPRRVFSWSAVVAVPLLCLSASGFAQVPGEPLVPGAAAPRLGAADLPGGPSAFVVPGNPVTVPARALPDEEFESVATCPPGSIVAGGGAVTVLLTVRTSLPTVDGWAVRGVRAWDSHLFGSDGVLLAVANCLKFD